MFKKGLKITFTAAEFLLISRLRYQANFQGYISRIMLTFKVMLQG